ncbi:aromatic prenyltransferase [Streptomyces sp. NPDC005728]|uniref:aromatic prenyltransferase n=1 Tax=Streptomyces sp. NPDC005728 TaxID=3157054 RepID=UPI0033D46D19
MSDVTAADEVYAVIEESARLVGAPCSPEKIRPILTAFEDALPEAGMVFSVATGQRPPGELDYTISIPPAFGDPYAVAVSHGLVTPADHPVATLLADIQAQVSISEHLIDAEVSSGFSKIYAHFPHDKLTLPRLADIPSMPPAVAQNAELFARHHLTDVAMIGIDYRRKTVNLYFAQLPDAFRTAHNILSLNRAIGLPDPSGPMLEFAQRSFRAYVTLGWDSPKIERISYAPLPVRDPSALAVPIEPDIEKFLLNTRRTYDGPPFVIAAAKWTAEGEHLNLGPYCRLSPLMRTLLRQLTGEQV